MSREKEVPTFHELEEAGAAATVSIVDLLVGHEVTAMYAGTGATRPAGPAGPSAD